MQFTFDRDAAVGTDGSTPGEYQLRIDNVNYSSPAYDVNPKGDDKNDGRTEKTAFATQQEALDTAQPGDIVVSFAPDRSSAYFLIFREASPSSEWQVDLPFLPDVTQPISGIHLGGDGEATLLPGRRLEIRIPHSQRFLFVKIEVETDAE